MIISIWGFMGSGKSTIGQYLAAHHEWQHLDSDQEIEKIEKRTINDIFAQAGESYFRDLETNFLQQLVNKKNRGEIKTDLLLTTGGGMPLRTENRKLLQELGPSIFLDVPFQEITRRLEQDENRPLWDKTRLKVMENKYRERWPIYIKADYALSTEGKELTSIAQEILSFVHKHGVNRET